MNDDLTLNAPGSRKLEAPLSGYVVECAVREVYVPVISSFGHEGEGHVGAFFDDLKTKCERIIVPTVLSERLEAMLKRRDFHYEWHREPHFGEVVECFVWRKPELPASPYDKSEQRVAKFIVEQTKGAIGGGDDPVGFILASYVELRSERDALLQACAHDE